MKDSWIRVRERFSNFIVCVISSGFQHVMSHLIKQMTKESDCIIVRRVFMLTPKQLRRGASAQLWQPVFSFSRRCQAKWVFFLSLCLKQSHCSRLTWIPFKSGQEARTCSAKNSPAKCSPGDATCQRQWPLFGTVSPFSWYINFN